MKARNLEPCKVTKEALLAATIEDLPDGIVITDLEGRIVYVNKATVQLFGYEPRELIGKSPAFLRAAPDNKEEIQQDILQRLRNNEQWCGRLLQQRKDGSTYKAELEIFPVLHADGTPIAWAGIQRDLEALVESEQMYQRMFNGGNDIVFVYRINEQGQVGNFVEINDIACTRLGYTREELLQMSPLDISCSSGPYADAEIRQELLYHRNLIFETKLLAKNGAKIPVEVNTHLFQLKGRLKVLSIARDLSERKEMEAALKTEKIEKDAILSAISDYVVYYDANMSIKWANRAAELAGECLGVEECYWIWHGRNSPCPNCPVLKTIETGFLHIEEITTLDGRLLLVNAYPVKNDNGETIGAVKVAKDITEAKQIEAQMSYLERLNLIGQMAAAIGHEVRNPMTTVRGLLQVLKSRKEYCKDENYFELMIEEIDRANSIITQFLSLAQNRSLEKIEQNLNTIVRSFIPLIQAKVYESNHNLQVELGDIPSLPLDQKEINQLILNLTQNGLEAMPAGGCLTIKTYLDGETVVLVVADQGSGIEKQVLEQLGTPFVTTKDSGTGLGLAVCYRIAENHNAKIEVETGPTGTTFFVRFPVNKKD